MNRPSCNTCPSAAGPERFERCAEAAAALSRSLIIVPEECPISTMSRMALTINGDGQVVSTRGRI